jgi:hypothetical protein
MTETHPPPFFPPPSAAGGEGEGDDDKGSEPKEGPVRTQMIGESPGDDLGYDPSQIPTEKIPDDDDDD